MRPRPTQINGKRGYTNLVLSPIPARHRTPWRVTRHLSLVTSHRRSNLRFRDLNSMQTIENMRPRPTQINGKRGYTNLVLSPIRARIRPHRQLQRPARHRTDCLKPEAYNARSMAQALIAIKPTRRLPPGPRGVNLL